MSSTFWVVWLSMTAFLIYANVQPTNICRNRRGINYGPNCFCIYMDSRYSHSDILGDKKPQMVRV